jgi:hypothetical protein
MAIEVRWVALFPVNGNKILIRLENIEDSGRP